MRSLFITERAKSALRGIYLYSSQAFGEKTAEQYISDLDVAIRRLQDDPLKGKVNPVHSERFRLLSVRKHYLVYEYLFDEVYILTVEHQRRDLKSLLQGLEEYMDQQIDKFKKGMKS